MSKPNFQLSVTEIEVLWKYHTEWADHMLSCKQSNVEIANREPLYTFLEIKTKQDWLDRAKNFDEQRAYHRKRARLVLKLLENRR